METNSFKLAARYRKVWALIDAIDRLFRQSLAWDPFADGFAIAHHLETWDAEKWASIALVAGCHPPRSEETKRLIIERYQARAKRWQEQAARAS